MEIDCERCGKEVELREWEDDTCPFCGLTGLWEEEFGIDDGGEIEYWNSWNVFYWDMWERK